VIEPKKVELLKTANITSVFGDTALGKSTFSLRLGGITKQDVLHLDAIRVKKPGEYFPPEHFLKSFNAALENGNCILDGTALDYLARQLEESNALVFFDGDNDKIMENFIRRLKKARAGEEEIIGFPGFYETDPKLDEQIIENFRGVAEKYVTQKELLRPKLVKFENKLVTVKNHKEIDNLVCQLRR